MVIGFPFAVVEAEGQLTDPGAEMISLGNGGPDHTLIKKSASYGVPQGSSPGLTELSEIGDFDKSK